MEKTCTRCNTLKNISEFSKKGIYKSGEIKYNSHCKECHKIFVNNHYKNNKQYYFDKRDKNDIKYKERYIEYKKKLKCFHCGFDFKDHPYVCDFHHINDDKEFNPSVLAIRSWRKFLIEIEKCIPLCANCHRIEHHKTL